MTSSPTSTVWPPTGTTPRVGRRRRAREAARRGDRRIGWALALLAWMIATAGSWIPSFWGDEAASVLSAQRSLPSLFRMLGHVDAVHGTYYLGLHFWIELFGASPFSVRQPAAIATGLAAAGLYFLVRELRSRRLAVVAVLIFAVLPRTMSFNDETRAYAFTAAFAAWSLVLLVRLIATETLSKRWWLLYAAVMCAGIYAFLYFGLFVVVHALVLLQARVSRATVARFTIATVGAVVAAAPVVVYGIAERGQVAFLAGQENMNPHTVLVTTWFGTWWFAAIAWALIAVAAGFLVADVVRDRRVHVAGPERARPRPVSLAWLGFVWFLGPLAVLMVGNFAVATFTARYLSYSTPAAALLIAIGVVRLAGVIGRRRPRRALVATVIGAALVVGLAVPYALHARTAYFKNDTGWQSVSAVIGANASAGDAIVFDESTSNSKLVRSAKYLYPDDYEGLVDVTLKTPYADTVSWHDEAYTVDEAMTLGRFDDVDTVWLVEYEDDDYGLAALEAGGFTVAKTLTAHGATILELTR